MSGLERCFSRSDRFVPDSISVVRPAKQSAAEQIDFLFVTILDSEFEAVRRHIPGLVAEMHRDDPIVYMRGRLPYGHGPTAGAYSVVLIQLNGMGNLGAAVAVTSALQKFVPQSTIVVGIAGGVPGELLHGDVAISRDLIYYESGKQFADRLEHRAELVHAHPLLWNHAKQFAESDWHARIEATRPDSTAVAAIPQVKVGTIGSGEKVVDSEPFITALKSRYKKLIAVAMEGSGAAAPAQYFGARIGDIFEIRGISDLADGTKDDRWQDYAADAAAAFTVAFLATGPISSLEQLRKPEPTPRPVTAIRLQSMATVNPADVVKPLKLMGATEVHDVAVDLLPFAGIGGKLRDVAGAVASLTSVDGPYFHALGIGSQESLAFYGQAHIPLAMLAGALASDRIPVRVLDFHRNSTPQGWAWTDQSTAANAMETVVSEESDVSSKDAVVRVSVSYPVAVEQTAAIVSRPLHAYDLSVAHPMLDIVETEAQAREYAAAVRRVLDVLAAASPRPLRVHIFYAGPVSVAFAIGQSISRTIHPEVVAWNYRGGSYDWGLNITRAADGETAVLNPEDLRSEGR